MYDYFRFSEQARVTGSDLVVKSDP